MRGTQTVYDVLARAIGPCVSQKGNLQILMYHRIQSYPKNRAYLPPEWFAAHMAYLAHSNYVSYTLAQVAEQWPNILDKPKSVVLTFDDLWASQVDTVLPILKQYSFVGTFFVPTAHIDSVRHKPRFSDLTLFDAELCNWSDIRTLHAESMDIGAHTHTHSMMSKLHPHQVTEELRLCKQILEEHLHESVVSFSYPFGKRKTFNSQLVDAVGRQGFKVACTTQWGRPTSETHLLELPRMNIDGKDSPKHFAKTMKGHYDFRRWIDRYH